MSLPDATNRRVGQSVTDSAWWAVPSAASATAYTANALNQYTAVGTVTPAYDGNGNLAFDGSDRYCYDAENRLTAVLSSGTCASPTATVAAYAYDGQGRRKEKVVGTTSTVFVTDADNREVLEYDGATGAVQAWYAYGLGSNTVLNAMDVTSGTRQTLIPDIQGSIIASLDSTGTLTKAAYHPYGESPVTSGSFRYAAMRIDPETNGLYYDRARMYSPKWGRFLQPDPIGYAGGTNLYAYTDNDPLNLTDPSGNCPWCVGAVIGGVAGAISGGIAGYHTAGTWRGAAVGAIAGAVVGAGAGAIAPWAAGQVGSLAASAGGATSGYIAAGTTFTVVNAASGSLGAAAGSGLTYEFSGGNLSSFNKDVLNGAIIGGLSGGLEAPFVAAGGGAALGYGAAGDAALSTQSAIFGTLGSIATSCSAGFGCGPSTEASMNAPVTNNPASGYVSDLNSFHFK